MNQKDLPHLQTTVFFFVQPTPLCLNSRFSPPLFSRSEHRGVAGPRKEAWPGGRSAGLRRWTGRRVESESLDLRRFAKPSEGGSRLRGFWQSFWSIFERLKLNFFWIPTFCVQLLARAHPHFVGVTPYGR